MKMKLVPSPLSRRSTANSCLISGGDSAEVGSSRMMIRAPLNSTRPSSTSCCRPERQPAAFRGRVDVDPQPLQMRLGLARHRPPAHDAGTVGRLVAEEHVLGHAQRRDDRQLLVDHADAGGQRVAGGAEMHRPPVDAHLAVIAGMDAGDDLHQRRLAGAVLADEAMHLAGQQREVDARQRGHAAERLADPGQLQDRLASARWRALAHVPVRSGSASASTACLPRWAW